MKSSRWDKLIAQLRGRPYRFGVITKTTPTHYVHFEAGLTDSEIALVEGRFGFQFPTDLRNFLETALPVGPRFPNWRSDAPESLECWLEAPLEGILFDVRNGFWLESWGPRPDQLEDALSRVTRLVRSAPRLIPVYGHRMLPEEPRAPGHSALRNPILGNPVLSVHQTDIIIYGDNLEIYLCREFGLAPPAPFSQAPRVIEFWSELVS